MIELIKEYAGTLIGLLALAALLVWSTDSFAQQHSTALNTLFLF